MEGEEGGEKGERQKERKRGGKAEWRESRGKKK